MGASRARIVRQLLTESVVLALIGGAAGLATGMIGARALLALYPGPNPFVLANTGLKIPRVGDYGAAVTVDLRVIVFTVVASLFTTLLFGIVPALRGSRADVSSALKADGLSSSPTPRQHRSRSVLVAVEIALALALMVGAALLIRSSVALRAVNPGFDPRGVLTLRMSLADTPFQTRAGIERLTREGVAEVRALPGVLAASTTCCVPFETVWQLPFTMAKGAPRAPSMVGWTFVSPGYFDVLRIPFIRGRDFTDQDDQSSPGVVIINEAMARRYWPDGDPLQDSILVGRGVRPDYENDPVRRIIGIVGNVRDTGLNRVPRPAMYVPVAQVPDGVTSLNVRLLPLTWVVRAQGDVERQVEAALQTASGLPVARPRYLDEVARESMARGRFDTTLMMTFAAIGLLLSAVGIYGLMAHAVEQQIPELGIRLALGADPRRLGLMVAARGLKLALVGAAAGAVGAWNLTQFLAALLFGVTPHDAVAFSAVTALLAAVTSAAVAVPAYRAAHVDPIAALRRS